MAGTEIPGAGGKRETVYIPNATLADWLNMFNAELGSEEVLLAGQRSQELGRKRETVYT